MEEDFKTFLFMIGVLGLPFGCVYSILYLLNWNEKKNLLLDSWFVFLAWLLSSPLVLIIQALVVRTFRYSGEFVFIIFTIVSLFIIHICAIGAVLYLRSKERKISIVTNHNDENIQRPNIKKILQTSVIVSLLTSMLVVSLFFTLEDYENKINRQNQEKNGKISFGIYD
jgi:hypothetical protein